MDDVLTLSLVNKEDIFEYSEFKLFNGLISALLSELDSGRLMTKGAKRGEARVRKAQSVLLAFVLRWTWRNLSNP